MSNLQSLCKNSSQSEELSLQGNGAGINIKIKP